MAVARGHQSNRNTGDRNRGRHRRDSRSTNPQAVYPHFTLHAPDGSAALHPPNGANCARYVGRVGALAVALGIGVVVGTGPYGLPVAYADTDSSSESASGAAHSTAPARSRESASADRSKDGSSGPSAPHSPAGDDSDGMKVSSSGGRTNSANDAGQATDAADADDARTTGPDRSSGAANDDTKASDGGNDSAATDDAGSQPADTAQGTEPAAATDPVPDAGADESAGDESGSAPAHSAVRLPGGRHGHDRRTDETDTTAEVVTSLPGIVTRPVRHNPERTTPGPDTLESGLDTVESTTDSVSTTRVDPQPPAHPRTTVGVVHAVAAALLAPIIGYGPAAPAHPPLLWAMLEFARREVQRTFFNRSPIAVRQEVTLVLGPDRDNITSEFHVHDLDGDDVTYFVPAQGVPGGPQHGSVSVDQGTGSFTYTPDPGFTGTDTFRVMVSDAHTRPHLHGLLGLLRPDRGHTDSTTVTVNVLGGTVAPVTKDDLFTAEQGNAVVGNVLANDTDPNGEPLTATLLSAPRFGTLRLASDGSFSYEPDPEYRGEDGFTYLASNGVSSTQGRVSIVITPVNRAPVGAEDRFTTAEDTPLSGNVLTNDSDPDGDTLTALLDSQATHGEVRLNDDGSFTYTPDAEFDGEDAFSYIAHDGTQAGAPTLVRITVTPVNDAPVPGPDSYTIGEDSLLVGNVLANDRDADGDRLTAELDAAPAHGQVQFHDDGSFTYRPDADYHGPDSFGYTVSDGRGGTATGTVSITVTPVNDTPVAGDDAFTVAEDGVLTGNLLGNDTDTDGDPLTATLADGPAHGTVTIDPDGSFTYTPDADFNGADEFTYTVSDGTAADTAEVTITVTPVNDTPVADDDFYTTAEDTPSTGNVLANDTDADGDRLTATLAQGPLHGTVTLNEDGSFTYTPATDFAGDDFFTYTASDGTVTTEPTVVVVTVTPVDDAPVADDDAFTTDEDGVLTGNVLANDTDADNDGLNAQLVSGPSHGELVLNPDGTFTYTPGANFNGTDGFTYTATDGLVTGNTATVTVTVRPVNDDPVAGGDSFTIAEDSTLTGNVLDNDRDIDGDGLTVELVSGTANGTLTLDEDGTFSYTPNADYHGDDSFSYLVSDGRGGTALGTVDITVTPVNDAPVAEDETFGFDEDHRIGTGVAIHDVDGDDLTVTLVDGPAHGTLTLDPDGTFTYTPEANFNGTDGFTYTVADGQGGTATATVTFEVAPVNDAPIANNDDFTVAEDGELHGDVVANDREVDGDPVTATLVDGPANGTVTLNDDGSFVYTPSADFTGTDSFTYATSDGSLTGNTALVTIVVTAVNDAQVAGDDTYTADEDTVLNGNVLDNDRDIDGDSPAAELISGPSHGSVTLNGDGTFTYTPDADYHGTDSFTYAVSDGSLGDEAVVTITVTAVNDAPVAHDGAAGTDEDTALHGTVTVTDVDGDPVHVEIATGPEHGTLTLNPDGTYTYTPEADFNGTDGFTYTATDSAGAAGATGAITITVNAVNDDPTATDDAYTTDEGAQLVGNVVGNDTDVDGDALTTAVEREPAHGTVVLDPDGSFTYTPDGEYHGADEFTYTVSDGRGGTATGTVSITVTPVNDAPVAGSDAYTTAEDTAVSGNVLDNDTDADGDTLAATVVVGPGNGTVVLNPDGSFTYTPNADYNGTDHFVYRASDGSADDLSTVTITVTPVNDAPVVAGAGSITVDEDTTVTGSVLDHVHDAEDDPLVTAVDAPPTHGTLNLNPDGSFTYNPDADYTGDDRFRYTVSDGRGGTAVGAVNITVTPANDAPVAADDTVTTAEDATVHGNVLSNDSDVDGKSDIVSVAVVSGPANGTVHLDPQTGEFTYTPDADYNGTDSFTYTATDAAGATSGTATVTINITPVPDRPQAADDAFGTDEDTPVRGNLLDNDRDPDGDEVTAILGNVPANGTVHLDADGTFTYTPDADFNGTDSFSYTITDATGLTSRTATVTITVRAVDDAPVAVADTVRVSTGRTATIAVTDLLANDTDADGDPISLTGVSNAVGGTVTYDAATGTVTFTRATGYTGPTSFDYTVNDGSTTTVTVEVLDNTAPRATDVQAVNGADNAAGRMDTGDRIVFTFSEAIDPASIMAGWDGATPANVVVRVYDTTVLGFPTDDGYDNLVIYDAADENPLPLGRVSLNRADFVSGGNGEYITFGATGTPSTMTIVDNTLTVTLGSYATDNPFVNRTFALGSTAMTWTPSAELTDLAGNRLVPDPVTESGPNDRDF